MNQPVAAGRLGIELFADGGIRIVPPEGQPGISTSAAMRKWVATAAARGTPIEVSGDVSSPLARAVLDEVTADVGAIVTERRPPPFRRGWTSLMWAAEHGLVDETIDLLERGADPSTPWWRPSPYRLAMRRGHVPVMEALRASGAEDPVLRRPPGAAEAIVMRMYVGWLLWWFAPVPALVGLIVGAATRSAMAVVVGAIGALALVLLGVVADFLAGRTAVAVDGPQLYSRRFWRWRGPVDIETLLAIGRRESTHRRSPTLLRLVNTTTGEPLSRRSTHGGLDPGIVEQLERRNDVRVLTIYLAWSYLRPGLERYVASFVDPSKTLVSASAEPLIAHRR